MLWNDIEWPDGGKGREEYGVAALLERYLTAVPDGVVNDRWGVPYHGFLTREYSYVADVQEQVWESTRGLGFSFGYNQAEDDRHSLSGAELIRLFVDVVAKNGNLLINAGPRADGSIPDLQLAAMRELGAWLRVNGAAVYGTRPWLRCREETGVPGCTPHRRTPFTSTSWTRRSAWWSCRSSWRSRGRPAGPTGRWRTLTVASSSCPPTCVVSRSRC